MVGQKCVVIVDDELDAVEMFAEMMRVVGYQVHPSCSGMAAIELIAEKNPAVVLLDLMMTDFSGIDVLKYIRRDPRLKDTPVVLISACNVPDEIQRAIDEGANAFLPKPVSFSELKQTVENAIQKMV